MTSLLAFCLAGDLMVVLRLLGDACKLWAPGDRWGQKAAVFPLAVPLNMRLYIVAGLFLPLTVP